jgi:hypothetical protein
MLNLSNGNPTSRMDTTYLESQCSLAPEENAVWCDRNGVKLLQYYPGWVSTDTDIYKNVLRTIEHLLSQLGPSPQGVGEARHLGFEKWEASLPAGTPSGRYGFTVYRNHGHPSTKLPTISADLLAKALSGSNPGMAFRSSDAMKDLSKRISLTFASIDPDSWDKYRQAYIKISE